jgi:3-hydroxyacyl-[acyl-carrier-protein] dehydratase
MEQQAKIITPSEHPSYEGHFPGRPVVPGVLLLELIVDAIARGAPRNVGSTKFHQVLAPGESCALHWTSIESQVTFRCARGAQTVAEGSLTFEEP